VVSSAAVVWVFDLRLIRPAADFVFAVASSLGTVLVGHGASSFLRRTSAASAVPLSSGAPAQSSFGRHRKVVVDSCCTPSTAAGINKLGRTCAFFLLKRASNRVILVRR